MIGLRGLHLGNIARSPAESVRPDLWPDNAWVPVLGCTGGVLVDLVSGAGSQIIAKAGTTHLWSTFGLYTTNEQWVGIGPVFEAGKEISVIASVRPTSSQPGSDAGFVSAVTSLSVYQFTIATNAIGTGLAFYTRDTSTGTTGTRNNDLSVPNTLSTTADNVVAAVYSVSRAEKSLWNNGKMVGLTTTSIDPITTGHSGTWIANSGGYSEGYGYFGWVGAVLIYRKMALTNNQVIDLSADPLLPFRRRVPVFCSVPSGGGIVETPAAMMMAL